MKQVPRNPCDLTFVRTLPRLLRIMKMTVAAGYVSPALEPAEHALNEVSFLVEMGGGRGSGRRKGLRWRGETSC